LRLRELENAQEEFAWIAEHPLAFARFKKDRREKDALAWYNGSQTKMMGRWSPSIIKMYMERFDRS
jgi:hypothetical protein